MPFGFLEKVRLSRNGKQASSVQFNANEADMADVITSKKPSRLDAVQALPPELQDYALIDWRTFALLLDRKDVEAAREWAMSLGLPLVNLGRRKLPRWKDVRALIEARNFVPEI